MSVVSQFVKFLREYNKLLERGTKNIYDSQSLIWIDDISVIEERGRCSSILPDLFGPDSLNQQTVLTLNKHTKPTILIPDHYVEKIQFNEAKNEFESEFASLTEEFKQSPEGKIELAKLERFKKTKAVYSKLFKAYNSIVTDTNQEIVLSIALVQFTRLSDRKEKVANVKTNQHLFHFPLKIDLLANNTIKLSFSDDEKPYADPFFFNNTPIKKERLDNIVDKFEAAIEEEGFKYLYTENFKQLVSNYFQQISDNSQFTPGLKKPIRDEVALDSFGISYAPAISLKAKKPRSFEKLTQRITDYAETNEPEVALFNLLLRNPATNQDNRRTARNYFEQDLFEKHKVANKSLEREDFTTFFPLPSNKEQKEIYEKNLGNKLTVVTGPPGTGKSHTIVNILCSLLAEGKRVLVTAQTDKALESLLEKIPVIFDDLIFTKIKLANSDRFSLERSVDRISNILQKDRNFDVVNKMERLDRLKGDYTQRKNQINATLGREYASISINGSFRDLRYHQIFQQLTAKDRAEWAWIGDEVSDQLLESFDDIRMAYHTWLDLNGKSINTITSQFGIGQFLEDFDRFAVGRFFATFDTLDGLKAELQLAKDLKVDFNRIKLDGIKGMLAEYGNEDLVSRNMQLLNRMNAKYQIIPEPTADATCSLSEKEIVSGRDKYLLDIQVYLSFIPDDEETIPFLKKQFNSKYKDIRYLEKVVINDLLCTTVFALNLLRQYICDVANLHVSIGDFQQNGFAAFLPPTISRNTKIRQYNDLVSRVNLNRSLLHLLQNNPEIEYFVEIFKLDRFDVEKLYNKAIEYNFKFKAAQDYEKELAGMRSVLKELETRIRGSDLSTHVASYYPFENIASKQGFVELRQVLGDLSKAVDFHVRLAKATSVLLHFLPNTFQQMGSVRSGLFTKQNFEYAQAHATLKTSGFINLQQSKEELGYCFKEISNMKAEILYDLARTNFQGGFDGHEIDRFINLLNSYKYNLEQGSRGIQGNARFKNLARTNAIDISHKLSCWIMKFTDVLNSIGDVPETFDCVIVDEASQLDFNSLLLAYYAKSMIIVGDDKQTSPSGLSGINNEDLSYIRERNLDFLGEERIHIKTDNSLFSLAKMVAGTANLSLNEHFRCVPELIGFSKKHFYDNTLRALKQLGADRLEPKKMVFVENAFLEQKKVRKEITAIKDYIAELFRSPDYEHKSIGVVSLGFADHTDKLSEIVEELADLFDDKTIRRHNLVVADASKFQGDERDVMIISLGAGLDFEKVSKEEDAKPHRIVKGEVVLTDQLKNINVALSRAKEQMILFYSIKPEDLKQGDFRFEIINYFKEEQPPLKELLLPEDISRPNRTRQNVPPPFDSWFEYDIARELIHNGYTFIKPQYEVKESELWENPKTDKKGYVHFKLDLVVFASGQMVAIECDGDPFHSEHDDIAYDTERQEFLERVGWHIYRILYSAYLQRPGEEVEKLVEFVRRNCRKAEFKRPVKAM
jgi:hypothetical protein